MNSFHEDKAAQYVNRFINATDQHVFLTGKAGTGKTTLLKAIVESTHKKTLIAAPTGIAAINAGGSTLHSLFHLPFGTFIPENRFDSNLEINTQLTTPNSLIKNLHMNGSKKALIEEVELLIIDEVSMLRADLLDAIDSVLRYVRRNRNVPFGGVQILFIGDLWQLPPVVKDDEWDMLKKYYPTIYFFNALALKGNQPMYIELGTIYRQTDQQFITLLNHFRINEVTPADVELLNQQYRPNFNPIDNPGYIYLTTHNYKADSINKQALEKLPGKSFAFKAKVEGDFSEYSYPVEYTLELKKGAQVMFIKNDYSGNSAYFNGKIGIVEEISNENIVVSFLDNSPSAAVEPYIWENKKFSLDKETREISETIVGKFTHYPLKLAWAITVHKSQGLTFDKAMIDISQAFAPGQIYVALSRLTSLKGLVLTRHINMNGPDVDPALLQYSQSQKDEMQMEESFERASSEYLKKQVIQAYSFGWMVHDLQEHIDSYDKDEVRSPKQKYLSWAIALQAKVKPLVEVANKFQSQISRLVQSQQPEALDTLLERVGAARQYFQPLLNQLLSNVIEHQKQVKREKNIKKYLTELQWIEGIFYRQMLTISKAEALCQSVINRTELDKKMVQVLASAIRPVKQDNESKVSSIKEKKPKGEQVDTRLASLELYLKNKSIDDTAAARGMSPRTIEGHLAECIGKGMLDVNELVTTKKLNEILKVAQELDTVLLSPIKELVDETITYAEIKYVMAYVAFETSS
ncbi:MAG: helix-turn-helix domain-containing protein [Salinivirgaceae bacterium]